MYKLYWSPGSAAMAPQAVLEEIGVAYEPVRIDLAAKEHEQAAYKTLNPNGRIPTLVDGDFVIFETAAICQYLSDKHGMLSPALGTQARGRHMQWLTYLTNTVQAFSLDWFHPDWTFATDEAKQAALKAEAERKLYRSFDVINDGIAPGSDHMVEGQFTICDIYLTMVARWSRYFARPMWHWDNINRVVVATHPRPGFQRMMQKQGISWPETWGR